MADSDKNILITPQTGSATDSPTIEFTGADNTPITLTVDADGSLSFSSSIGELFSITNSLQGILFSTNDANNTPIIEVEDDGTIYLNEFKGNTLIGTAINDDPVGSRKLQVAGDISTEGIIVYKANGHEAGLTTATLTGSQIYTLPNATGVIALTTDIPTQTSDLTNDSGFITSSDVFITSVGDFTASAQGNLSSDFTVSTGTLSLRGSALGLSTTSTPTFAGLNIGQNGTLTFEGSTDDEFETTLTVVNPSEDRTISLPDNSGTIGVTGSSTTNPTQGRLNITTSITAAGLVRGSGSASGLSQTDEPKFAKLTLGNEFARIRTFHDGATTDGDAIADHLYYGRDSLGTSEAVMAQINATVENALVTDWAGGLKFAIRSDGSYLLDALKLSGKNKSVNVLNEYGLVTDSKKMDTITNNKIVTYTVVVQPKTGDHIFSGQGSGNGYVIDDIEAPHISLIPNVTYRFDQSDSTNSNHPLGFYLDAAKTLGYTTNFTYVGTAGSAGAYAQLLVTDATPSKLYYQCGVHSYMGSSVDIVNHNLSGFTTDDLTEGTSNRYFSNSLAQGAFSQGTGVTISSGTISIGQDVSTSSSVTFQSIGTNGSITVNNGANRKLTAPELNLTSVGEVIKLNSDLGAVAPTANVAISVNRGSSTDAYIEWDESNDVWVLGNGTTRENILTSGATGIDADTLDGEDGTYYLNYNNFNNNPTSLLDFNISDGLAGQVLQTDGNGNFSFTSVSGGGGSGGSGFVAVEVYHYTSSGSQTFGTATNQWLYFQPFVNGVLVDDANYNANTQTGIVTISPAPTTGSDVTIWAYNSSVLDNLDQLSVANTGDLTVGGDVYATNGDFSGYINYGIAQQGTANFSVSATPANPTFTYTANNYRGAKLLIHVRDNTSAEEQIQEALILTNGSLPQITSYANIYTGSQPLMDFDVSFSGGTTSLVMTRSNTNNMTVKIQYTMIES